MTRTLRWVRAACTVAAVVAGLTACGSSAEGAVSLTKLGDFSAPDYVTAPPGDKSRLMVVQQGGTVIQLTSAGVRSTFADLTSLTAADGERGLLSIVFAPDFATSRKLYAYYVAKTADHSVTVDELTAAPDLQSAPASSRRNLLTIPHDKQSNHNGGQLQFGPDGMLYVGVGDGGSGGDPSGNAQSTSGPVTVANGVNHDPRLGKILRLDPATGGAAPGNPGFGEPRIWAYGLRNPFRFSFDRATGDLTIGDVGQDKVEEVDFASAASGAGKGLNFGWNLWEGNSAYTGTPSRAGYTFPVVTQSHDDGYCSVIGGYVVRDPDLPDLAGQYVYGDFCKAGLRAVTVSGNGSDDHAVALTGGSPAPGQLTSFGEDACGRVYVTSDNGSVYRMTSGTSTCVATAPGTGTGTTPGGGGAAPGTTPVALTLTLPPVRSQRVARTGVLTVRAQCTVACTVVAAGAFRIGKTTSRTLRLRRATRTLKARTSTTLTLKVALSTRRRIARELRRHRTVKAIVALRATAGGIRADRTLTVRVRR